MSDWERIIFISGFLDGLYSKRNQEYVNATNDIEKLVALTKMKEVAHIIQSIEHTLK